MSKQHNTAKRNDQEEIQIPETDLTSAEIEDILIKGRIKMLLTPNAAFFGNLACRLIFKVHKQWNKNLQTPHGPPRT